MKRVSPDTKPVRLMQPRRVTAEALGCSVDVVIKLEKEGVLTPVKLFPNRPSANTYHAVDEVVAYQERLIADAKAAAEAARQPTKKARGK